MASPGYNVDAGAKVVECFWEVHHVDGDRDDGMSWIVSLDRQKVSNYFHNGVAPLVTSSSISSVFVLVDLGSSLGGVWEL